MVIDNRMKGLCVGLAMAFGILAVTPAQAAGPAPVDLGSADRFVILARMGIFNTGATSIVGDIGISPNPDSFIAGFGLVLDATGTYSTSLLVDGLVFAANYAVPTPTMMIAAVSDMETAYLDAADRTAPDFTDLHGGDLTGRTLVPGLYTWGTGVLISAGGVTLSGGPTDVWIFQIAQDLVIESGGIVTLTGGASAANVFWQVAGETTLGTTSQMKGIVLCADQIAMGRDASLLGRALAQAGVTLDANIIRIATSDSIFNDGFETANTARSSATFE